MKLKEGDKIKDTDGNEVTFLAVYGVNRDFDFVGKNKEGVVRNYAWHYIENGDQLEKDNPGTIF